MMSGQDHHIIMDESEEETVAQPPTSSLDEGMWVLLLGERGG